MRAVVVKGKMQNHGARWRWACVQIGPRALLRVVTERGDRGRGTVEGQLSRSILQARAGKGLESGSGRAGCVCLSTATGPSTRWAGDGQSRRGTSGGQRHAGCSAGAKGQDAVSMGAKAGKGEASEGEWQSAIGAAVWVVRPAVVLQRVLGWLGAGNDGSSLRLDDIGAWRAPLRKPCIYRYTVHAHTVPTSMDTVGHTVRLHRHRARHARPRFTSSLASAGHRRVVCSCLAAESTAPGYASAHPLPMMHHDCTRIHTPAFEYTIHLPCTDYRSVSTRGLPLAATVTAARRQTCAC
ncbi:hypothetical protein T440DRAFT_287503 [Plenodomus tracheiphilus IPT5]|uniref:Uncharacterized protein n=1 Tax=Plenodomus tracheiphilus IPT5 TaxID=1408161 RepID=A0A6A7BH70_9PLEO|nr:hypothetical protein T440DRAFT_287503 [Plenodomus tracheiphilus IPT5]